MASAKFLLRQATALASLAKETADDECRERCLRLEQVYRSLAMDESRPESRPESRSDGKDSGTESKTARA